MSEKEIPVKSFTLSASGKLNSLQTNVILIPKIRNTKETLLPRMCKGIWDTGASASCISQRLVDEFDMVAIGKTQISTANGLKETDTHLIDVILPNNVTIQNIVVSSANLGPNLDILIGMDIIGFGDFAITNVNGRTTFSFRVPSICIIDFNHPDNPYNQLIK